MCEGIEERSGIKERDEEEMWISSEEKDVPLSSLKSGA